MPRLTIRQPATKFSHFEIHLVGEWEDPNAENGRVIEPLTMPLAEAQATGMLVGHFWSLYGHDVHHLTAGSACIADSDHLSELAYLYERLTGCTFPMVADVEHYIALPASPAFGTDTPNALAVCRDLVADRDACGIDESDDDDPLARIVRRARHALASAPATTPAPASKLLVDVRVEGGCVRHVAVPPGVRVRVFDYDIEFAGDEDDLDTDDDGDECILSVWEGGAA
jgi:hypothetical protein